MSRDCCFMNGNNWFRYRVGAIIIEDGCVLFARNEADDYYYSVGGGVHMGEKAEDAIVREVFEETGIEFEVERLAVIHENFFLGNGVDIRGLKCHEISFYYIMKSRGTRELDSKSYTSSGLKETMHWIPIEDLGKVRAYPSFLKDNIDNLKNGLIHIVTDEMC